LRKKLNLFLIVLLTLLSLPGFCQEDDDKDLQELEAAQRRRLEKVSKIANPAEENPHAEIKKLQEMGHDTITMATLMDENTMTLVKKMMEKSPLQKASKDEVRLMILERSQGSAMGDFFSNSPMALDMSVDIMRDKKALPSLIGLVLKRGELRRYFAIWICLMLLSWLFKKIFFKKSWSRGKFIASNLTVSLSVSALSFMIFYKLFEQELSPTLSIIFKHLFA
jgi:hypothetical protein